MMKQAGPSSTPLLNDGDLDAFINNFDASVVGKYVSLDLLHLLSAFLWPQEGCEWLWNSFVLHNLSSVKQACVPNCELFWSEQMFACFFSISSRLLLRAWEHPTWRVPEGFRCLEGQPSLCSHHRPGSWAQTRGGNRVGQGMWWYRGLFWTCTVQWRQD